MINQQKAASLIARRYAQAFIHCFSPLFSSDIIDTLHETSLVLEKQKKQFFFIDLFFMRTSEQKAVEKTIVEQLPPIPAMQQLVHLLMVDKRLALLPRVIKYVTQLLLQQQRIMPITIETFPELREQEKEQLISAFSRKIGYQLRPTFVVNKNLIAGIKMKSATLLWEQSIDQQLRKIQSIADI